MVTEVKNDADKIKIDADEKAPLILYHPIVKLDKSQRELRFSRNNIKLKGDHDKDA